MLRPQSREHSDQVTNLFPPRKSDPHLLPHHQLLHIPVRAGSKVPELEFPFSFLPATELDFIPRAPPSARRPLRHFLVACRVGFALFFSTFSRPSNPPEPHSMGSMFTFSFRFASIVPRYSCDSIRGLPCVSPPALVANARL